MSELAEGVIFSGRYRVVRCIAAGGMGAVYEVIHLETERRRALKVMHAQFLESENLRERFKLEARVAAQIESDFIVDVFDAGIDETTQMPFLVMELLRGEELGKRLKRAGRLTSEETVMYLYQTALALDKTHKASIVHRDLKPQNLFLTEREEGPPLVKVLDFGIAKIVAENSVAATQSIGTPLYMSPEQFNPSARLTGAADIYALGMIAYTLLVGKSYWAEEARGGNLFALAAVSMSGVVESATARAARHGMVLPPWFDPWFARITALDPTQRFPTATEAVRRLAQALGVSSPGTTGPRSRADVFPVDMPGPPISQAPHGNTPFGYTPYALTPVPSVQTAPISIPVRSFAPMASRRLLTIGLTVFFAVASMIGVGVYLVSRRSQSTTPTASAPEASASAMASAVTAASVASPSSADIPAASPLPSASAAPGTSATASASASVSAGKRATTPATTPRAPAPPKSKYTRE